MAQHLFGSDTSFSLVTLDANFNDLYPLINVATVSSDYVSWTRRLAMNGGNTLLPGLVEAGDLDTGITWPAANNLALCTGGALRLTVDGSGHFLAGADNTQTMGSAAKRWSVVYAGTGTINTSDAREKTAVEPLSEAELSAAKQLAAEIGTFHFLAAVAKKGDTARLHVGMTVQRAMEILRANGLDPLRYGFICHDEWPAEVVPAMTQQRATGLRDEHDEPLFETVVVRESFMLPAGDRYGFRPDELLLFIARGQEARLAALEAKT